MDFPLALVNGAPLPDFNLPAEPPEEPYQPLFPLVGSLSVEEQRAVDRLVRLENQLIRSATHMLRSLNYAPQPEAIKTVVEAFILDINSDDYEGLRLAFINVNSPLFQEFLDSWEDFLSSDIGLLEQNVITPRT